MRIVPRLTAALFAGTCLILAANGYLRVKREVAIHETDRLRDHEMIGRALAASAAATWRSEGEGPALASIVAANEHFTRLHIRWVGSKSHVEPRIALPTASPGAEPLSRILPGENGRRTWFTYVPLDVKELDHGWLELAEPALAEGELIRAVVRDTVATTLALALLSALLSFAMGQWLVGRPIRELAAKARRIGRGDFSGPIQMRRRDELDELATEMNTMAERLSSTLEQLRHADRLTTVGKLASGVAHELGTPLNVVSARASMIASGDTTPDESKAYAQVVVAASERMIKIVRQLLQFARRQAANKTPSDLVKLTEETIALLAPLLKKAAVDVRLSSTTADTVVAVDPGQFQQVVTNLVMNAVQATPSDGRIDVTLSSTRELPPSDVGGDETDTICLRVRDRGAGIDPAVLPHVFEPFFTTKDVGEGTGLGLPVSYGIVREHGGWIGVATAPGQGTTFSVFLPRPQGVEPRVTP